MRYVLIVIILLSVKIEAFASYIVIPMDEKQSNHLKAYGISYWILENETEVDWLLNFRGGSFGIRHSTKFENECVIRGVSYEVISDAAYAQIINEIANPDVNMDLMKLEK